MKHPSCLVRIDATCDEFDNRLYVQYCLCSYVKGAAIEIKLQQPFK